MLTGFLRNESVNVWFRLSVLLFSPLPSLTPIVVQSVNFDSTPNRRRNRKRVRSGRDNESSKSKYSPRRRRSPEKAISLIQRGTLVLSYCSIIFAKSASSFVLTS